LDQAVTNSINCAYAEGSLSARRSQTRKFLGFCSKYQLSPIPVTVQDLCHYAVYLSGMLQYSSLIAYIDGVRWLHIFMEYSEAPISHPKVKLVLRGLKRTLSQQTHQKLPFTPEMLLRIKSVLDLSIPLDKTLWAVILCGWYGFFRRSNLLPASRPKFDPRIHLRWVDFTMTDWGFLIAVRWFKTIQFRQRTLLIPFMGVPNHPLCPRSAVSNYFQSVPAPDSSPAFVVPDEQGHLKTLTYSSFSSHLNRVLSLAGYQTTLFATHSLRRGGATFAAGINCPSELIQLQGDWKSSAYLRYTARSLDQRLQLARAMAIGIANQ
jgi:hypothetical protein